MMWQQVFNELTKKWTSSRIVLIDNSMSSAAFNAYGDNFEVAAGRTLFSFAPIKCAGVDVRVLG